MIGTSLQLPMFMPDGSVTSYSMFCQLSGDRWNVCTHQIFLVCVSEQADGFGLDGMEGVIRGLEAPAPYPSTEEVLVNVVNRDLHHKMSGFS